MTKDEIDFTKFKVFSTGRNWIVRLMNLNDKSVKIAGKTYIMRVSVDNYFFCRYIFWKYCEDNTVKKRKSMTDFIIKLQ